MTTLFIYLICLSSGFLLDHRVIVKIPELETYVICEESEWRSYPMTDSNFAKVRCDMLGKTLLFKAFSSDSVLMTEGTYKLVFEKTDTAYTLNKSTFEYEKIVVDEYLRS